MAELKPCPFCGGRPHFDHYHARPYAPEHYALKHTCKGGSGDGKRIAIWASPFDTKAEAVELWNRRSEDGRD